MRMSREDRLADLKKVRAYLNGARKEIEALDVLPRVAHKFPFDIVGLANLTKAFALADACLRLLILDCPDEAHGLSRSLVECSTNLRYLTADLSQMDKHTHDFVNFALADKAFWYHHALQTAKTHKEKDQLRAYAKQVGVADNPKLARQHWSGVSGNFVWTTSLLQHPLDGPVTEDHRKRAYAVDYYQTSSYVHCSLPAINYFVDDGAPFRFSAAISAHETYHSTLFIVLIYVQHAIAYVLYGMNIDRPARLDSLFQKTLDKMKPVPTRHSRQPTKP